MPRIAAKRILGSKKRKRVSERSKGGTKIKLKIKSSSPQGMARAVKGLAGNLG